MVTGTVKQILSKFDFILEKKMKDKVTKIQTEMQEKVDALSIENEHLTRKLKQLEANENHLQKKLKETSKIAKVANASSNYNEQYSRKNNIKVQDLVNIFISSLQSSRHTIYKVATISINVFRDEKFGIRRNDG